MASYPWIREWGKLLGSKPWYISEQVKLAQIDGAPENAIYKKQDGTWAVIDDVTEGATRHALGLNKDG